jgi:DNA repair exonuclease SbcCD ATPase subunit
MARLSDRMSVAQALSYGSNQAPTPIGGGGARGASDWNRAPLPLPSRQQQPYAAGRPVARHGAVLPIGQGSAAAGAPSNAGARSDPFRRGGGREDVPPYYAAGGGAAAARLGAAPERGAGSYGLPPHMAFAPVVPMPKSNLFPASGGAGAAGMEGLEARVAALERSLAQHDAELHGVKQEAQVGRTASRALATLDEQIRSLAGAQDAAGKRLRWVEETLGAGDHGQGGGPPHTERLRQLRGDVEQLRDAHKKLEPKLMQRLEERGRELGAAIGDAVGDVDAKLTERMGRWVSSTEEQIRQAQDERTRLEERAKEQVAAAAAELGGKLRALETATLPTLERTLRDEATKQHTLIGGQIGQIGSDMKALHELATGGDEQLRRDVKELQSMTQKSLLSLKSEAAKKSETLARLLKEEITTRALNVETAHGTIEELRARLESEMESCGQQIATLQGGLGERLEMVKMSVDGLEQSLGEARRAAQQGDEELRAEVGASNDAHAENARMLSMVSATLQSGFKDTLHKIGAERGEREQAIAAALDKTTALDTVMHEAFAELRSLVAKADIKLRHEGEERESTAVQLREEIQEALGCEAQSRQASFGVHSTALVEAEGRLEVALDQATASLRTEIELERTHVAEKLSDLGGDVAGDIERLDAELSRRVVDVCKETSDDLSERLATLQDETSTTLVGFRGHMDAEFEAEANRRDELRDELKSAMEVQAQDGKSELEFALSGAERQITTKFREELRTGTSQLEGELRKLHEQTQQAIDVLDDRLVECGSTAKEVQVLRSRFTASEEALTRLQHQLQSSFGDVAAQQEEDLRGVEGKIEALAELVEASSATVGASSGQLDALVEAEAELRGLAESAEEERRQAAGAVAEAEATTRVALSRMEERATRVSGRLAQQEALLHTANQLLATHQEAIPAVEQRLTDRVLSVAKKLGLGLQAAESELAKQATVASDASRTSDARHATLAAELGSHVDKTESRAADAARKVESVEATLQSELAAVRREGEMATAQVRVQAEAETKLIREQLDAVDQVVTADLKTTKETLGEVVEQHAAHVQVTAAQVAAIEARAEEIDSGAQNGIATIAETLNQLAAQHEQHVQVVDDSRTQSAAALANLSTKHDEHVAAAEVSHKESTEALAALSTKHDEHVAAAEVSHKESTEALAALSTKHDEHVAAAEASHKESTEALAALSTKHDEHVAATEVSHKESTEALAALSTKHDEHVAATEASHKESTEALKALQDAQSDETRIALEKLQGEYSAHVEAAATGMAGVEAKLAGVEAKLAGVGALDDRLGAVEAADKDRQEAIGELQAVRQQFEAMEEDVKASTAAKIGTVAETSVGVAISQLRTEVTQLSSTAQAQQAQAGGAAAAAAAGAGSADNLAALEDKLNTAKGKTEELSEQLRQETVARESTIEELRKETAETLAGLRSHLDTEVQRLSALSAPATTGEEPESGGRAE